jgi:hypothetical protein
VNLEQMRCNLKPTQSFAGGSAFSSVPVKNISGFGEKLLEIMQENDRKMIAALVALSALLRHLSGVQKPSISKSYLYFSQQIR